MDIETAEAVETLRADIHRVEHGVGRVETSLTARIDDVEGALTVRIDHVETSLTAKIERVENTLTAKIDHLEKAAGLMKGSSREMPFLPPARSSTACQECHLSSFPFALRA
jgi:hypothetical protein